jgi:Arc/MetJ-type ribon-helix-helix transcriptional regulator
MKTITVNVSEPVYRQFQEHARRSDRTAAELIREAMELYRRKRMQPSISLAELAPVSVGEVRRPFDGEDDLLKEMLDAGDEAPDAGGR